MCELLDFAMEGASGRIGEFRNIESGRCLNRGAGSRRAIIILGLLLWLVCGMVMVSTLDGAYWNRG